MDTMTLWILSCRMSENMDILFAFYAKDQEQAEQQARKILKEQGYERLVASPFSFFTRGGTLRKN
jgi:hypothetical protein